VEIRRKWKADPRKDGYTFHRLNNLNWLDLADNQIASIETGDFAGLYSLLDLDLSDNQITSIEAGDFAEARYLSTLYLSGNRITSLQSSDFTDLGWLAWLYLDGNQVTDIGPGDFAGLNNLRCLDLRANQIVSIEPGAFAGMGLLHTLCLGENTSLTNLNLEGADLSSLSTYFDVTGDLEIARVSLRDCRLNQTALATLVSGSTHSGYIGIGELPGVTELDLSGVDFAAITDLSPLYLMDRVTDLWLVGVENMNADALDVLLDNLATMQNPSIEGTLYLTRADYNAFNTAGDGKLALWDAEPGHHVQIVPEPGSLALLAGMATMCVVCLRRRKA
jgi:Leucine-rich repeat (LRR) protein